MDLLPLILAWGREAPGRLAHVSGSRSITYGDLVAAAESLAGRLTGSSHARGSPLAVLGHKEPEMLVAFLAAALSGHPYIPIDVSLPAHRIERILVAAGSPPVLTPETIASMLIQAVGDTPVGARPLAGADPCYIIFTSGSTGDPKGVVVTLDCLQSFVEWMLSEQDLHAGAETFLNQAPFSFDLSVMDLYLSLATGGTLFSVSQHDIANPRQLYRALAASGISVWVSTPSFAEMCLADSSFTQATLPGVRRFLFCGETLAPELATLLLERFPVASVWNTYGPTEATCATTSVRVTRELLQRYPVLPVGFPKPDARVWVGDTGGAELPVGQRGEIFIAGPNVSAGYLARPDLTERSFFKLGHERAYRTGDMGYFQDGMLFFAGRTDDQIKLHGHRIELGDVEANLRALPHVLDAVVVPVLKQRRVEYLAAFLVLDRCPEAGDLEMSRSLKASLAARVPPYMVPRRFRLLQAMPLTANGKADRRRLAEMLA